MNIFVYGTLMSGQCRADVLPYPRKKAFIYGRLYDCPALGFPFVVPIVFTVLLSQELSTRPWYEAQASPQLRTPYFPKVHGELVAVHEEDARDVLLRLDHMEGGIPCYRRGMVTAHSARNKNAMETAWVYYAPTEDSIYACGVRAQLFPVPSGKWSSGTVHNTKEEM